MRAASADAIEWAGQAPADALPLADGFEQTYTQIFPQLYAFLRSQVRNRESAEDLVSLVFQKALAHRAQAPVGDAYRYWIFRIAKNTLIDYWRVEGRRVRVHVGVDELESLRSHDASPEASLSQRETEATLLKVVGDLEESDRLVLSLKFAGGRTNREIAAILDLKEGAVSMRLLRALRKLRERLNTVGVS